MAYPYSWAEEKFVEVLQAVREGATDVYEVRSLPLTSTKNMAKAINQVKHGSALWQHTDTYHIAMIYIERGKGQRFNRTLLDLIASGVDSKQKFRRAWLAKNHGEEGSFPRPKSSSTSSNRQKHASYIVADFNKGANPKSKIAGRDGNMTTHRTHLISAQTTGIEANKGLLIDFDGWLNMKPLNEYETSVLELTRTRDLIWTATVWREKDGLHYKYIMYTPEFKIITEREFIDDRWTYLWYYD